MNFLMLIFKNIWRNKTRTFLTILGIAIGIATIVIFGLATSGMKDMFGTMLKPAKTDFTVAKADSIDMIVSFVSEKQVQEIKKVPGVEKTIPYVMGLAAIGTNPYFLIGGVDPKQLKLLGGKITDGKIYKNGDEVIIGKITAKNHKLKIGDSLKINKKNYHVTGIFESGITYQDSGALTTIEEAQKIQGVKDQYTVVMVEVKANYNVKEVAAAVEKKDKELVSILDINDYDAAASQLKMMDSISWTISLLAIVIGGIGVMNTIVMSVFERTREIGVLRAVGWKRKKIMAMIISESFFIGIFAAIFGIALGLIVIWLAMQTEIGKSWLDIQYQPIIFIRAIAVSLIGVILGSIYPAFKASKLEPTEALRYE